MKLIFFKWYSTQNKASTQMYLAGPQAIQRGPVVPSWDALQDKQRQTLQLSVYFRMVCSQEHVSIHMFMWAFQNSLNVMLSGTKQNHRINHDYLLVRTYHVSHSLSLIFTITLKYWHHCPHLTQEKTECQRLKLSGKTRTQAWVCWLLSWSSFHFTGRFLPYLSADLTQHIGIVWYAFWIFFQPFLFGIIKITNIHCRKLGENRNV